MTVYQYSEAPEAIILHSLQDGSRLIAYENPPSECVRLCTVDDDKLHAELDGENGRKLAVDRYR
jgi:hypothetical protein